MNIRSIIISSILIYFIVLIVTITAGNKKEYRIWEMVEIELKAEKFYDNYYTDVTVWVELNGPGFSKRIYGFWDGDNLFKVRVVATNPGDWNWISGSNHPGDA